MFKNVIIVIGITAVVGLISAAITYFRTESMAVPGDVAYKGLAAVRKSNLTFYGVFMPALVAVISWFVFRYLNGRSPVSADSNFLWLAAGLAVVLTVGAAVFFKRGVIEFTAIHAIYVAGFGWLMPRLLTL